MDAGLYNLTLSTLDTISNCQSEKSVEIKIGKNFVAAKFDMVIDTANNMVVLADSSIGKVTKWIWNFGDLTSSTTFTPAHSYDQPGLYSISLIASNQYGCSDTILKDNYVTIYQKPIVFIPNVFTPNGDGQNDELKVFLNGSRYFDLMIFNRWGEKVFESTEKTKGWDGRYKNVMQEMEVYAYTLSVEFFDGTKTSKNGNITLLK